MTKLYFWASTIIFSFFCSEASIFVSSLIESGPGDLERFFFNSFESLEGFFCSFFSSSYEFYDEKMFVLFMLVLKSKLLNLAI
jgi:hypothetical protein